MSRIRSDSIWNSLPPEQRDQFEDWLFEERIGYKEASERALKEWGIKGSESSVSRFYRRIQQERVMDELEMALETASKVNVPQEKLENLKSLAVKVVKMRLVEDTVSRGDVKELAVLNRVLTQSEARETQRGRLALAQKRFEFNAAKEVLKQRPLLEKMAQEDQEREDAKVHAARLAIFGTPPTDVIYDYGP